MNRQACELLAWADGALFCAARDAAGEDVEFVVLGQEFYADVVLDLVSGFCGEFFSEFGEEVFGGADVVGDGGIGGAHFLQHGFGGDAAMEWNDMDRSERDVPRSGERREAARINP